jgi:hypothetical protein
MQNLPFPMMDTVFVLEQSRVQPKVATLTAEGKMALTQSRRSRQSTSFLLYLNLRCTLCIKSNVSVMITII